MDHEIHIVEGDTPQAIEDSGTHLKEQVQRIATRSWPWVAVTVIVSLNAGLAIINKKALNEGLDHYVFSVYRNIIAVVVLLPLVLYFERTSLTRPTLRVVLLVCALAMLEPVMDQNFLYAGSHKTPASLSSSISITQPVFTFVLAWIFRLEHINIKTRPSQAKVLGTIISVGGAIIIATYTGQVIPLPWTNKSKNKPLVKGQLQEITIVGMIYCLIGVSSSAAYAILLAKTLPLYPAPLTLTTGTCLVGALINFIVAQVLGSRYGSRWMIDWNIMFLSYFYAGVMVSAFATYLFTIVTRVKGPVIVAAFSPLSMILVTSIGTIVLAEQIYVGRVLAAGCIVIGISLIIWGKSRERNSQLQSTREQDSPPGH